MAAERSDLFCAWCGQRTMPLGSEAAESDVAAHCGLSYNHFSSSFKKAVGRSFSEYITLVRMSEAEKMLISSEKSVTDIALSCGFSSTSYFISRFKNLKGVSPGQWRRNTKHSP